MTIILQEASFRKSNRLETTIQNSPFGQKLGTVRLATSGPFETSDGRHLHFFRFVCAGKRGRVDTLELLSPDRECRDVIGVVTYHGSRPEKTIYFKKADSLATFLNDVGSNTKFLGEDGKLMAKIVDKALMLAQHASIAGSLLMTISALAFLGKWYIDKMYASRDESRAKVDAEKRLNAFLFKDQTGNEAAFDSYKTIVSYIQSLIAKQSRGVTLYGMPGTGKTYIVRRTLHFAGLEPNKDYVIVKGSSASAEENIRIIYSTLYAYNGKIIVFDDFDSALSDPNTLNLLKAALDSYPVRIVSLPDLQQYNQNGAPLPTRFEFTGRIVMITNMTSIDPAILSRTRGVAINFTSEEFQRNIHEMLEYVSPEISMDIKKEVYEYLTDSVAKDPSAAVDFRRFSSMLDMRLAYPDQWLQLCHTILYPSMGTAV